MWSACFWLFECGLWNLHLLVVTWWMAVDARFQAFLVRTGFDAFGMQVLWFRT